MGHTRRKGSFVLAIGMLPLVVAMFLLIGLRGAQAETGKKALILETSVSGGATSAEATRATAPLGFAVTKMASDASWGATTAAQFSDYQLLVVGDPTCSSLPARSQPERDGARLAMRSWLAPLGGTARPAMDLVGTDPRFSTSARAATSPHRHGDRLRRRPGGRDRPGTFRSRATTRTTTATATGDEKELLLPKLTKDPARYGREHLPALRRQGVADRERRAVLDPHHRQPAGLVVLGARDVPEVSRPTGSRGDRHGHADEADLR